MTTESAKGIIDNFHNAINDGRPDAIVQSIRDLKDTKARIKYAHFVYGEDLLKYPNRVMSGGAEQMVANFENEYQELMESYGIIDSFFVENPEPINNEYRNYLKELRNGIITNYKIPNPFGEREAVLEFHNFLGECWFLEYKTNLFTDNPLGSFLYEGLRDKYIQERDIKSLIDLVNTAKTRKVNFPGRKTNEKSVF